MPPIAEQRAALCERHHIGAGSGEPVPASTAVSTAAAIVEGGKWLATLFKAPDGAAHDGSPLGEAELAIEMISMEKNRDGERWSGQAFRPPSGSDRAEGSRSVWRMHVAQAGAFQKVLDLFLEIVLIIP